MFGIGTKRDWLAMILIMFAVPLSVFGGANIACVGQGLSQQCSYLAVVISPLLLIGAGIVAGLITSGWTGLFVVGLGQIVGQVVIVLMAFLAGRPDAVNVDWFSAIVATLWFGAPIAIGYGLARAGTFLVERRRSAAAAAAAASTVEDPPQA